MSTRSLPLLNEDDVRAVLTYEDLIPALRAALIAFSAGEVVQPVRTVMPVTAHGGWFATMPAVYGDVMGAKLVTFYPGNAAKGQHTHHAMIQLFRADTGEPLAVMDGRLITEMRTACVSALAVDQLAAKDARLLAILGSGVQARSHMKALACLREFDEVRVWSRTSANAKALCEEIDAESFSSAEEAVTGADVVLCLTSSAVPVLMGRWLKQGAMVCAIGAVTPDRRELDSDVMRGSVVVESRVAAEREAGDILLARATVDAEIGELLAGKVLPVKDGPVVFKSLGIAIEDVAAARLVYDKTRVLPGGPAARGEVTS